MYDYIIIGAGSAGCVMANRLSANPNTRVLLLEAGPTDRHWSVMMPFGVVALMRSKTRNWGYYTVAQKHMAGREMFWPRGKTLGGSSSINAMIYTRGHRDDYNDWAELGLEDWSYDRCLPYFRKSEHNERITDQFHGNHGPLNVTDPRHPNPLCDLYIEAGKRWGLKETGDFNGAEQEGVGYYQLTQKEGQRFSAARAYLWDAQARPNLTILTGAHVMGIEMDGKRARGVRFKVKNEVRTEEAAESVILCGGGDQFAPGAAIVRHRRSGRSEGGGHRGPPRIAGGRQEPARPPGHHPAAAHAHRRILWLFLAHGLSRGLRPAELLGQQARHLYDQCG